MVILYVERSIESLVEAEAYIRSAELVREEVLESEEKVYLRRRLYYCYDIFKI